MGYRDCLIYQAVRHFSTARGTLVERRLYGGYVFSCRKLPGCSGARESPSTAAGLLFSGNHEYSAVVVPLDAVASELFRARNLREPSRMTMSMARRHPQACRPARSLCWFWPLVQPATAWRMPTWWIATVPIDQLVAVRGLTASAAGLIVTAEMVAMSATSFVLAKVLKGGRFLTLGAAGTLFAIAASFISLRVSANFPPLLITRVLVGLGEGSSVHGCRHGAGVFLLTAIVPLRGCRSLTSCSVWRWSVWRRWCRAMTERGTLSRRCCFRCVSSCRLSLALQ